jgi:hypothetical protein
VAAQLARSATNVAREAAWCGRVGSDRRRFEMALTEIPGLYIGVDNFAIVAGPLMISTSRSYLCLYSSGIIVNGYPDYGLEMTPPDPTDPFAGRYAPGDGMLDIEWNDGTRTRATRVDPTVLQLFGRTYARLDRCTDLALDGTYARLDGDPDWPVIRFGHDGTFDDQGILMYTGLKAAARWLDDRDTFERIRGSGTWHVSNNTLYLDYAGVGQITACIYVPFGRSLDSPISEFDLNGFSFVRTESLKHVPPAAWTPGQL